MKPNVLISCSLVAVVCSLNAADIAKESLSKLSAKAQDTLMRSGIAPLGPVVHPTDNPSTKEKIDLGKLLYFDKRLSMDETISCATCHDPKLGWAEEVPVSLGIHKQKGPRNAPSVLDSAFYQEFFWDSRAHSLEEQALGPIQNPKEMGMDMSVLLPKLQKIKGYNKLFMAVFGDEKITDDRIAKAIACFERTVVSGPSRFDAFLTGNAGALNTREINGLELFLTKGSCTACHRGPFLTNQKYGRSNMNDDDAGRATVSKQDQDKGLFRIPTLRNVALTGPYFHNGSEATLEGAVFFRANNVKKGSPEEKTKTVRMSPGEVADITAFLKTLDGKLPDIEVPASFPQ